MSKIGVFPASGGLGTSTYRPLLKFVSPADVVLISRHPERTDPEYLKTGVETRKADYDVPDTLEHVFDNISCLYLVSYPSIRHHHRVKVHKLAIEAARRSGVSHIFYTSLGFGGNSESQSDAFVMQAHLDTEKYLAESASSTAGTPFTWTSIREGIYAETWPMYTGFPDISQAVIEGRIPHDWCGAGVPWVKRNDLGEGSARLIQQYVEAPADFAYVNKVMLLTGTKNWNLGDTLKAVGKLLGKKVQLYHESEQAYAKRDAVVIAMQTPGLEDLNVPKEWATVFEAIRKGETSVVSPDLKRLLGREPADFESILRALLPKSN